MATAFNSFLGTGIALWGAHSPVITSADVTLTEAQAKNLLLLCSGALTGARNLILPTTLAIHGATISTDGMIWIVYNGCSGEYTLTVKTAAGSGVVAPQGQYIMVRSDGANIVEVYQETSAHAYNSANISHTTSGTWESVTHDSERFDTDNLHSVSSNTSRITIRKAGKYAIGGLIEFAANATGLRGARIRLNGATVLAQVVSANLGAGDPTPIAVQTVYSLAAGDYVELQGYQASGGALNMLASANYSPTFWAHRI